jgi:hypothetical protein
MERAPWRISNAILVDAAIVPQGGQVAHISHVFVQSQDILYKVSRHILIHFGASEGSAGVKHTSGETSVAEAAPLPLPADQPD